MARRTTRPSVARMDVIDTPTQGRAGSSACGRGMPEVSGRPTRRARRLPDPVGTHRTPLHCKGRSRVARLPLFRSLDPEVSSHVSSWCRQTLVSVASRLLVCSRQDRVPAFRPIGFAARHSIPRLGLLAPSSARALVFSVVATCCSIRCTLPSRGRRETPPCSSPGRNFGRWSESVRH